MALVNKADEDRETIDEYLGELDKIHEKQVSMLTKLHEVSSQDCFLLSKSMLKVVGLPQSD